MEINDLTAKVIGLAMRIHSRLGPGLFESVYESILEAKLLEHGYKVDRQKPVDIEFDGLRLQKAFKVDLLIDGRLVVEVKSVEQSSKLHAMQLLTYLRMLRLPIGLVINFNCTSLKDGIRRVTNDHTPP